MRSDVPTFELYGEDASPDRSFWIHSETIEVRSSRFQWEIGVHRHALFHQLFLIRSGIADIVIEEKIVRIEPPALIIMPPDVSHGFRFSAGTDGLVFTVFSDALKTAIGALASMPLFSAANVMPLQSDNLGTIRLMQFLSDLHDEAQGRALHKTPSMEGYLKVVYALIARVASATSTMMPLQTRREQIMESFLTLLYRHMRRERAIGFYSEKIGITETHLNRVCKAATGLNAQTLIATRMIEEAKRQLIFSARSVQDIAFGLGFADPAYFNRFFRRHAGVPPQVWRRQWHERSLAD